MLYARAREHLCHSACVRRRRQLPRLLCTCLVAPFFEFSSGPTPPYAYAQKGNARLCHIKTNTGHSHLFFLCQYLHGVYDAATRSDRNALLLFFFFHSLFLPRCIRNTYSILYRCPVNSLLTDTKTSILSPIVRIVSARISHVRGTSAKSFSRRRTDINTRFGAT